MTAKRLAPVLPVLLIGMWLGIAPRAAAAPCGATDPETDQPARATLTLDEDSVAAIAYKRASDPRTLLLRFRVVGCELSPDTQDIQMDVLPKLGEAELPAAAVSLVRARRDPSEFSVRLSVDPDRFDPGTYGGFIELRGQDVGTLRTPIAISRSEDNPLWPLAIGALGGAAGLFWFWLLNKARGAVSRIRGPQYLLVFAAAAVAGVVSVASHYLDQEVWSVGANGLAAAVAAFTGATTGAMATAIGVLWGTPKADDGAGPAAHATPREATSAAEDDPTLRSSRRGRFRSEPGTPQEAGAGKPTATPRAQPRGERDA